MIPEKIGPNGAPRQKLCVAGFITIVGRGGVGRSSESAMGVHTLAPHSHCTFVVLAGNSRWQNNDSVVHSVTHVAR